MAGTLEVSDSTSGKQHNANMENVMTRALILGATALTLSAGVAAAQVAFVSPGRYGDTDIEDYNNPDETMAQRVGLAPTLRRLVTPPLLTMHRSLRRSRLRLPRRTVRR